MTKALAQRSRATTRNPYDKALTCARDIKKSFFCQILRKWHFPIISFPAQSGEYFSHYQNSYM